MNILELIATCVSTSVLTSIIFYLLLNYTVNRFGQELLGFFDKGIVKRGMSILGKQSGESRRNKALENEIASGAVEALIGKWKIPLSIIGVDLDDLMERYSPMELLNAVQTFLPMLKDVGIDISQLMGQVTGQQEGPQSSNKIGL